MPKMKSHKGMRKRLKITKRGKVLRRHPGKSHLMTGKTGKRRRHLRRAIVAKGKIARKTRELMSA